MDDAGIRIVDLRCRPRRSGDWWIVTDDRAAYEAGHVPGAVFTETTQGFIAPRDDGTMPVAPPEQFAEFAGAWASGLTRLSWFMTISLCRSRQGAYGGRSVTTGMIG